MNSLLSKTFGGLTQQYYFRNFVFACAISAMSIAGNKKSDIAVVVIFSVANAFLYPYSRFVYESAIEFVMGENVFIMPLFIMLPMKLFTMTMCWLLAILIAPIGLIYLYFYHHEKAS